MWIHHPVLYDANFYVIRGKNWQHKAINIIKARRKTVVPLWIYGAQRKYK